MDGVRKQDSVMSLAMQSVVLAILHITSESHSVVTVMTDAVKALC